MPNAAVNMHAQLHQLVQLAITRISFQLREQLKKHNGYSGKVITASNDIWANLLRQLRDQVVPMLVAKHWPICEYVPTLIYGTVVQVVAMS